MRAREIEFNESVGKMVSSIVMAKDPAEKARLEKDLAEFRQSYGDAVAKHRESGKSKLVEGFKQTVPAGGGGLGDAVWADLPREHFTEGFLAELKTLEQKAGLFRDPSLFKEDTPVTATEQGVMKVANFKDCTSGASGGNACRALGEYVARAIWNDDKKAMKELGVEGVRGLTVQERYGLNTANAEDVAKPKHDHRLFDDDLPVPSAGGLHDVADEVLQHARKPE
jgi:hypothetical protein